MKTPTISLIIPAHNEEKYIGACLLHVIRNSNNKLLEIIVVDNASTDKTTEVASKYPGVKVISESRKGVMWAREKGRLVARGEILAFIDADNLIPPGWVDKIEDEFTKNDSIACLSGPYIYHDVPKWQHLFVNIWYNVFAFPIYSVLQYMLMAGNFAIRADVARKMNGFDTSIDFYGDDTSIARNARKFGPILFKKSFYINASGRRFSQLGIFRTGTVYATNFFSQVFIGKAVTKSHKDFR